MPKYSDEAKRIWPFLLPYVEKVRSTTIINTTTTSSGGGGGVVVPGDTTTFLLRDGTRSLTGNWAIDAGVTIDGVDISAHAADPDAHHNRATPGTGINMAVQEVSVNQAYPFVWTTSHTFNATPTINANLIFGGADRSITASADLTLQPTDDLWFKAGGFLMLDIDQEMRTPEIVDLPTGIRGIRLWERSDAINYWQLTMGAARFDELYARVFVADETRISRGEQYWSKSFGIVEVDFVLPAIGLTVDVWFEDSPALTGSIFEVGDWLLLRSVDVSGGIVILKCWFTVDSLLTASDGTHQQWRLTRKKFGTTGAAVKKGNTILDAGVPGQGWIHLSALSSMGGPFMQVGDFTSIVDDEPIFTPRARMGNLEGTVDYGATETYGFAAGNNLGLEPDAGFSGLAADAISGLRLFNTDISLYDTATLSTVLHRTYGLSFLNDTALFANELRTISWFDDLANLGAANATARISAWGGTSDRRLYLHSQGGVLGTDAASVFLTATGSGGSDAASLGLKAGWDTHTTQLDVTARDVRFIGGGARMVIGGDTSKYATAVIQAYDNSADTGASTGITIEQAGGGDALFHWMLSLGQQFTAGIDNSDGDKFKISAGSTLGTGDAIIIDATTGEVTINGLSGGSVVSGLTGDDGIDLIGTSINVDSTVVRTSRAVNTGDGLQGGGNLSVDRSLSVDSSVVRTTRQVNTGDGLQGGGSLSGNLTLSILPAANSGLWVDSAGIKIHPGVGGDGIDFALGIFSVDSTVVRTSRTIFAGNGLTGSSSLGADVTLHVGASNGISVSADAISVALGDNPGLSFSGTGGLLLGTPAALSVATTNLVSGSGHTHAVNTSSDVGGGAQFILASTPAGGLGLATLTTSGAVTVGQGLTAGGTGFRVISHTHDYDHVHVVINPGESWNLDEQFGLDIDDNLLVRGWIVGKHAIQLDGATMLLHYDGPERVGNLSGQTRGHLGQVPVTETGLTFAPGKFGKAVQVPAATTNLVTNPSFEGITTGWSAYSTGGAGGTRALATDEAYAGTYSYRLEKTVGALLERWGTQATVSIFSTGSYTISAWVNIPSAVGGAQQFVLEVGGVFGTVTTSVIGPTDGWVRLSVTASAGTSGNGFIFLYTNSATAMVVYVDAVQVEASSYATAYADGTLGNGHAWTGTAHASSSTRTAGQLSYATSGVINQRAGSFMAWVYPRSVSGSQMVMSHFVSGDEVYIRALDAVWDLAFSSQSIVTSAPVVANSWQHIALTWEDGVVSFYVGGEQVYSQVVAPWEVLADVFAIGYYIGSIGQHWSGLIDDVVILGRASPPDEVRAVYESDAPVFAETSTWQWRAGRNRIYADAEGLWGLGASGGTILGLYAGAEEDPAATKSWGGRTLSEGDLLLGQVGSAKGGWMLFDQDLVGGLPAWVFGHGNSEVIRFDSGGASLTGVLDLEVNGGVYQGSGTFASPSTGLKIWNDTGVGRIAGYNAGALQWSAGTDGKLTAGAGNVVLDAGGVRGYSGGVLQWEGNTSGKLTAGGGKVALDSDGLTLNAADAALPETTLYTEAVTWRQGSVVAGHVVGKYLSSFNAHFMYMNSFAPAGGDSTVILKANSPSFTGASLRLDSDGEATLQADLTVAGHVTLNSIGSGTTWTPSLAASSVTQPTVSSYTIRTGRYRKIGDLLWFTCFIRTSGYSSVGASGEIWITGLPWSVSTSNVNVMAFVAVTNGVTWPGTPIDTAAEVVLTGGNTVIRLFSNQNGGSRLYVSPTALSSVTDINVTGFYFV